MGRGNEYGNKRYGDVAFAGQHYRTKTLTMVGNLTLDAGDQTFQCLDTGAAARNLTMPTAENGLYFIINNISAAAQAITVKNPAATTVGTIAQNKAAIVISDGVSWYVFNFA